MTRWDPKPWEDRFWAKVDKNGACWLWTGHLNAAGYGHFNSLDPDFKTRFPHRIAWMLEVGPIPEGTELDHLCRNPGCLNPAHLEPVDHSTNLQRGAQGMVQRCRNGHPYTPENTYRYPVGNRGKRGPTRDCRACRRERMERYYAKLGGPAKAARDWRARKRAEMGSSQHDG